MGALRQNEPGRRGTSFRRACKGTKRHEKEVAGVNDQVVGAGLLGVDSSPPFVSQVVLANVGVLLAETLCALVTVYLNRCLVSMQR